MRWISLFALKQSLTIDLLITLTNNYERIIVLQLNRCEWCKIKADGHITSTRGFLFDIPDTQLAKHSLN